jgi:hypothetical protein
LQFRGELADDSLDVPSYMVALISGVIIYAWFSELSYCPEAIVVVLKGRIAASG